MNLHVIAAIFRRNFVSYFSNPTGYVFICVFVLLGSFAAFWPDEFFNTNLANLDQLNRWFPYIMLVFIPAITMSIWADERRQGTDELLLTIPAADIDVVLGKYFAAVAIFTVSLLFSLICNLAVLGRLGQPDVGLFLGTYFGYWFVGLAMLAIGMVASFLTGNLTVAFILGVVFNAPLVFLNVIDAIVRGANWTASAKGWSIGEQMSDFDRGVISFASIAYFLMIAVVMLYLCMVLIGRRHWLGGHNGKSLGPHYVVRALSLVALAVGVNLLVQNWNVRADVTQERLNSVADQSKNLIRELDPKHPIVIEAYISPNVPEEFVETRVNLLNLLREFKQLSGGKIETKIHDNVEPLTEDAQRAEQQFGITPQEVFTQSRGVWKQERVLLGAAITSGLEKIVIPFFERGIPVEYELVRSIATIAQQKKQRVGVLQTDAELFGGFDMSSGQPQQKRPERLIEELQKQYEVVRVDPSQPITEKYDVLLAIQPSSLPQAQLANFIEAVKKGQPTAIFEDPLPAYLSGAPGTGMPRRSKQQGMMAMFQPPQQPEPKGDIKQLFDMLGVELVMKSRRTGLFGGAENDYSVVWQNYKPRRFEGFDQLTPEYVFIEQEAPHKNEGFQPFNESNPVTSGLQSLIFPLPGGIRKLNAAATDFEPLVKTGTVSGEIMVKDVMSARSAAQIRSAEGQPTELEYVLAAHITGTPRQADDADSPADQKSKDGDKGDKKDAKASAAKSGGAPQINVILVADVDLLGSLFFDSRARRMPDNDMQLDTDNVTFVLNALDILAGDNRFIDVRKKRPKHRSLEKINEQTQEAREKSTAAVAEFKRAQQEQEDKLEQDWQKTKDALQQEIDKMQKEGGDPNALRLKATELSMKMQLEERNKAIRDEQLRRDAEKKIEQADFEMSSAVRSVQDSYKLWSVLLPPIPPLAVAFFVYFHRRTKEREGVSKARLR